MLISVKRVKKCLFRNKLRMGCDQALVSHARFLHMENKNPCNVQRRTASFPPNEVAGEACKVDGRKSDRESVRHGSVAGSCGRYQ